MSEEVRQDAGGGATIAFGLLWNAKFKPRFLGQ